MKKMFMLLAILIIGAGCGDDDNRENRAHVWKEQTDTMDKARAVEDLLQDAADAEREQIETHAR